MNLLKRIFIKVGILPFLLVFLFIFFGIAESRFVSIPNMMMVSRQATYLALVTTAQMMTILCSGFDLSVGSSVALTSIVASMVMIAIPSPALSIIVGILAGITVATLIGLTNGITIAVFGVSPFVVTLGMMSVAHGFALLISGGVPIFNLPDQLNAVLGSGKIGVIPVPLLISVFIVAIIYIMLNKTRIGRYFYALGGNKEAARLSGIAVKKYICLAYVLCGTLTGIAGIMLTARVASGEPNLGSALPLESIAAAVIGGVSLRGGEGNLIGAIFGAILIILIRNGMNLMNISSYLQMVVMGGLLIFAVVMDQLRVSVKNLSQFIRLLHNFLFCPISVLEKIFNPRNTSSIPAVKNFSALNSNKIVCCGRVLFLQKDVLFCSISVLYKNLSTTQNKDKYTKDPCTTQKWGKIRRCARLLERLFNMNFMKTEEYLSSLKDIRSKFMGRGIVSLRDSYISSGRGALLIDIEGKEYIDFAGGIGVMNVGHSHPKVVAAIKRQAEKFTHTCFMVTPYEAAVKLAEKLCSAVVGDFPKSVFFANSGAEAVENAVKFARYYTKREAVIGFENAFHGRTLLSMTLNGKVKPYRFGFGPFAPEIYRIPYAYCYRCPFNLSYPSCDVFCADNLKDFFIKGAAPENTAAVIIEPIQGEGGFITPPEEYFLRLKRICEDYGILFIADEIQTGMGRTGKMFAMEHYNVEPDLMTSAKSLAAGMPLSAVIGKKEIIDSVHEGGVGGTYNGNPVSCEAALAVFDIFETENLLERSYIIGEKLKTYLEGLKEEYEIIGDVRGLGPMMAFELVEDREKKTPAADFAKSLVKFCLDKGLILISCGIYGNVVRFLMPLVITDEELDRGFEIVKEGLDTL